MRRKCCCHNPTRGNRFQGSKLERRLQYVRSRDPTTSRKNLISQLKLVHYKGFKNFTINFKEHSLLLGPNNAGKSTITNALRLCGAAAKVSMRLRAKEVFRDGDRTVLGHFLSSVADDGFDFGNIAHEFQSGESRLELTFSPKAKLIVVWPEEDPAFFWVDVEGANVNQAAQAKLALHRIGLVPTLTPVDRHEKVLSREHLASNVETRLASRHLRNNLRAIQQDDPEAFRGLVQYICDRTPEITTLEVETVNRDGGAYLDLFFRHPDSRIRKEIVWAGDGLQIWVQILFHLWRSRAQRTIILDEPDVFLHPDLQRRLIRVVEERPGQSVLASHSSEVAGEASTSSLIWVDRTRRSSRAVTDDLQMENLSTVLGSSFNLSIAKALRAKTALFVEGHDMKILRILARKLDATRLASEIGIAVVPIGGFSHWPSVEAFTWIKSKFLGRSVSVRVILDRDYRDSAASEALIEKLADGHVKAHVWKRKEIESYLLEVPALERVTGLSTEEVGATLTKVLDSMRSEVFGQFQKVMLSRKPSSEDSATTFSRAATEFDLRWSTLESKVSMAPAKTVISRWNEIASVNGSKVISADKLARALRKSELDPELSALLLDIESEL